MLFRSVNRVLLFTTIAFCIIFRRIHIQMPEILKQNQWIGVPFLALIVSLIITTAQLLADRERARRSGLVYHEGKLQYTFEHSGGGPDQSGSGTRIYRIETVDSLEETKSCFVITGRINRVELSGGSIEPRAVKSVRIPKYFEGLESILNEMKG